MEVGEEGAEEVSTTVEVLGQGEEVGAASSSSSVPPAQQQMIIVQTSKEAKEAQQQQLLIRGNTQILRVGALPITTRPSPIKVHLVGGQNVRRVAPISKSLVVQQPMLVKQSQAGTAAGSVVSSKVGGKVQYYRVMPATDVKPTVAYRAAPSASASTGTPKAAAAPPAATGPPSSEAGPDVPEPEAPEPTPSPVPPAPAPSSRSRKKSVLPNGNRKPCNCTKSMCLKLYCDCFANGEFCANCNCKDCHNNLTHESERTKAIKQSLERNPHAFQPKIGKGRSEVDRMHQKGCHCKKSSCLKNYCECYEAKVPCTSRCKCQGCRNTEHDREAKGRSNKSHASVGLLGLASAASSADMRSDTPFTDTSEPPRVDPKSMPWTYMTDEVVECTTLCLMAQAEELEKGAVGDAEAERRVLREFGRCLHQIIANAAAATSSTS